MQEDEEGSSFSANQHPSDHTLLRRTEHALLFGLVPLVLVDPGWIPREKSAGRLDPTSACDEVDFPAHTSLHR